jgi:hypothetical protein
VDARNKCGHDESEIVAVVSVIDLPHRIYRVSSTSRVSIPAVNSPATKMSGLTVET